MDIITLPSCPYIVGRGLRYNAPTLVNKSEWTSAQQAVKNPQAPMWLAEVKPFTIEREDEFWPWSAFFGRLDGRANAFRLPVLAKPQIGGVTVRVKGGGQTGFSLLTDGWGTTGLKAGMFITVNEQLQRLVQPATPAGGDALLTFDRWLWAPPADNALVTVDVPTALMKMSDDVSGWDDDTAPYDAAGEGRWTIGFSCEEAKYVP